MAARPVSGRLAALLALAIVLPLGACGKDAERGDATAQRERLVRSAKRALVRYNRQAVMPGVYRGPAVRLRVLADRRVDFSIRATCRRRWLRAFPDRPPRLRRGGRFAYRERGRRYRLAVRGRVRPRGARGKLRLRANPRRGRRCRATVRWRAAPES